MKKNYLSVFISSLLFGLALLLLSCEKKDQSIPVSGIKLEQNELSIVEGETIQLNYTIMPEDATNIVVKWSTSAGHIASVDQNGLVEAIKPGKVIITVSTEDGEYKDICNIVVEAKVYSVESVELDNEDIELTEGEFAGLQAEVLPENADNKNISWKSSNDEVATVNQQGLVVAVAEGNAIVTVTTEDGAKTATCNIKVNKKIIPVEEIKFSLSQLSVELESTLSLVYTILPEDATNKAVTFKSSESEIATVDESGIVTPIIPGITEITVTTEDGNLSAVCSVEVLSAKVEYIDEYGVNHGEGVSIGGLTWAPVNCGYHIDNYKYGKLYQWGRPYGQFYWKNGDASNDANQTTETNTALIKDGPVEHSVGVDPENKDFFYKALENPWDWASDRDVNLAWEESYDPCPEGWRVPSVEEMESLTANLSPIVENEGIKGVWASGPTAYSEELIEKVFMPFGGLRMNTASYVGQRTTKGHYWTSNFAEGGLATNVQVSTSAATFNGRKGQAITVRCVRK